MLELPHYLARLVKDLGGLGPKKEVATLNIMVENISVINLVRD